MIKRKFFKRTAAILLVMAMTVSLGSALVSHAATADQAYTFESDSVTLDDWKQYFGANVLDTENAGRIWNDKSVFTDPSILGSLNDMAGTPISLSVLRETALSFR